MARDSAPPRPQMVRLAAKRRRRQEHRQNRGSAREGLRALFVRMLHGLRIQDLEWLLNIDQLGESLRVYDKTSGSLLQVGSAVPWPVQWLLTRFHKKHMKRPVDTQGVAEALRHWERKMLWRWWHEAGDGCHERDTQSELEKAQADEVRRVRAMLKDVPTPSFTKNAPIEVKACLHACKSAVQRAVGQSRRRVGGRCTNMTELWRWGMRLLRSHGWATLPYDKEPGVCIVHRDVLQDLHAMVLNRPCYEPVSDDRLILQDIVRKEYFEITRAVGKLDGNAMRWTLDRSMHEPSFWYSARLMLTVKSHKDPVEFRNVHSSSRSAFAGLSCWLTAQLQPILDEQEHILKDCPSFVRRLAVLGAPVPGEYMVRIDIKEFYMSGSPEQLSELACRILPCGPRRDLARKVAYFLLHNQFIMSNRLEGGLWRVIQGSGQGQQHSGAIADACFLVLVDQWVRGPNIDRAFALREYTRFKDDVFIVLADRGRWKQFWHCMRYRCRDVYRLWVERISPQEVNMLAAGGLMLGLLSPRNASEESH